MERRLPGVRELLGVMGGGLIGPRHPFIDVLNRKAAHIPEPFSGRLFKTPFQVAGATKDDLLVPIKILFTHARHHMTLHCIVNTSHYIAYHYITQSIIVAGFTRKYD
jgi:hypothetical protein